MAKRRRRAEAMLLAPGAGSDSSHSCLMAIESALAPLPVTRMDFPYRLAGRRAPDRAPVLLASVREHLRATSDSYAVDVNAVVLGGRSMGGRMCSMVVAEDGVGCGLVLISYPLHPPGKPDRLRVDHLPAIRVPCLFVSGDRDPFGTPSELAAATSRIAGAVTTHTIAGGRHDLKGTDDEVAEVVAAWVTRMGPARPRPRPRSSQG